MFGFAPLANNGDECALHGFILHRVSLWTYRLFRAGEAAMEFEFRDPQRPAHLARLFQGRDQIRFSYSAGGRWERIIDSVGRTIQVVEEGDGCLTSLTLLDESGGPGRLLVGYKYDERGNLVATTNASGHGYKFSYDDNNRLLRRTGRKGFTFRFAYDSDGRCIKAAGDGRLAEVTLDYQIPGRVTKVSRADGGVWTYLFDESGGLIQVLDPLGATRKFVRDEVGRVTTEIDPNENPTRIVYDAAGAPVAKVTPLGHRLPLPEDPNAPDPLMHRVAANPAEYELGRLLELDSIIMPDPGEAQNLPIAYEIRRIVATRAEANGAIGRPRFDVRPLGIRWWPRPERGRVFNELGKLIEQHDEMGRQRRWTYDASGNMADYFDFDGGKWVYDYGSWHFLLGQTNPLGATVRFSYTVEGTLTSFTDAGGTRSDYVYELRDCLAEVRRHGRVRDRYVRDAAGNLVSKYGADGRLLLKIEIGPGNLPTKRTLASGEEQTFEYDDSGRCLLAATQKDAVEFAYDPLGNRCFDGRNGKGIEHYFGGWQALVESVFFDRFAVGYERRRDGTAVITDPGGKKHRTSFKPFGIVEWQFSNGSRQTAQYDNQGRCWLKCVHRSDGPMWSRRYEWSGEGELRRVQDSALGETRHEYDVAHRLRRRVLRNGRNEEFELDLADNLLRQPGLDDLTLQEGNRLGTVKGFRVEYDDRNHIAARQTPEGSVRYSYDSRDQLIGVESPKGVWKAEYDALGRRTRKSWAGETTEYYWNTDQLIAEVQSNGQLRLYIYADPLAATPLMFIDYDSVEAAPESGRRYFIFTDQIGTPCLIEDESGNEVWRARIEPYGQAHIASDAKIIFNLRFPGHYFDSELGLHYNRFRYYDPALGRYIQSDPWGIAGGYNVYAYRTNPLLKVDVRGLGEENDPACRPPTRDEEGADAPRYPPEILDGLYGPATAPWMVRPGEGHYPTDAHVVIPGRPVRLRPYTAPDGSPGRYLYIVDHNGVMHIAPEHGGCTAADGSARRTTHADLAEGGPARISGEINPTNDPNVWVMDDNSGRYSNTGPPAWNGTRTSGQQQNANANLNQGDLGGTTVVNEADLYGR